MTERFQISTVMDIVRLAPDQRGRFVIDLLRWCEMQDVFSGIPGAVLPSAITWIDDGKHHAKLIIKTEDQQQTPDDRPAPDLSSGAGDE